MKSLVVPVFPAMFSCSFAAAAPVPALRHPLEHLEELETRLGARDLARVRMRLLQEVAVGVRDALERVGSEGEPLVGEDGVGGGQLFERDLERAERERRIRLEFLVDARGAAPPR